jgi:hypothetical protein
MPSGPIFGEDDEIFSDDEPIDSTVAHCRQAKPAPAPKNWDLPCVLKILCAKDKAVVDDASKTQKVSKIKRIFFEDPIFDGTKWTTKHFEAGGTAGGGKILFVSNTTCEDAATTLYHEVWHTKQPAGMGWPHPAEDDAYYNTELWTIANGLPSQGQPPLRTTDAAGNVIPDKAAITKEVDDAYPVAPPPPVGWGRTGKFKKGPPPVTEWVDTATGKSVFKPSVKGETFSGPQQTEGKQTVIPSASLKCP